MFKSLRYTLFLPLVLVAMVSHAQAPIIAYTTPDVYTVGTAITQLVPVNTGGTPNNYSISFPLPAGLVFNVATGTISGTPTVVSATASYTVTATNPSGTGNAVVTITVESLSPVFTYATPDIFTEGTAITPLNPTVSANGPIVTWAASSLPPGLTINPATGVITGTPTTATSATNYTITATNASSATGTFTINITTVPDKPAFTYASPQVYAQNAAIANLSPANTGGTPISYSTTGLPPGLVLDPETGIISGTPTVVSAATAYSITATNAAGSTTANVNISVVSTIPVIAYSTPDGYTAGTAITPLAPVNTGGMPVSYSINTVLPAGLTFSTVTGVISGTPTVVSTVLFTVTATNPSGSGSATLTITVNPAPLFFSYTTPETYVDGTTITPLNPTVIANGPAVTYSISGLPPGLTVNPTTGQITGTPTTATVATQYTITGTSASGGTGTFTITITTLLGKPVFIYATPQVFVQNTAIVDLSPVNSGSAPASYSAASLPPGLVIDPVTGIISGTPTTVATAAAYTITATNAAGNSTASLTIAVVPQPPVITYSTPGIYNIGTAIATLSPANTGGPPASFAISRSLPPGLTFNTATGVISGTPTTLAAAANYTITATNGGGSSSFVISITVNPALPVITYNTPQEYVVGTAIDPLFPTVLSGMADIYAAAGLPAGLVIDPVTGEISGTPTVASAAANYTVTATNPGGNGATVIQITIDTQGPVSGQNPLITSFSPASGPVGTLVTITGANLGTPTAFSIGGVTALLVNNNGTVLTGLVMPGAVTGVVSLTTNGVTATAGGNFTVTPTPYPVAQQGSLLVGTGSVGAANQGNSVAVSADGNTAIVGGSGDNSAQGALWVYTRNGTTWNQQGSKLVVTGNAGGAALGVSAALSADGNTAIVGGPSDNGSQGAAWVFTHSGDTWSQQGGKLVGTGSIGPAQQGFTVSISADGNTAIVGGLEDNSQQGAAWVYTRSGGAWTQQGGKLVGTGSIGTAFQGGSVGLSADGNTAIIGGFGDNGQGAVWVFTRSGGTWTQQGAKLVGTDGVGGTGLGRSASLSADGNTAIAGGNSDNKGQGAAWVFTRSNGAWTQQGDKLTSGVVEAEYEGSSVSLSADGNTAIVGGFGDSNLNGAAWIYTRNGTTWTRQPGKLVGTGNTGVAWQGESVSLSANGSTAFVGGYVNNKSLGAAWVFTLSNNALLSGVILSPYVTLTNTGTVGNTITYTASVVNTTASVTVTAATQGPGATIKVNGTTVASGTASSAIPLIVGANAITVVVTAQDGVTTQPYIITITRAKPSIASLSELHISAGKLSPVTGTPNFTSSVGTATTTVTAATTDPNATLTINGTAVPSSTPSAAIPLTMGSNTITIVVTAQDGVTTQSYIITVNRLSNVPYLSHISISSGTLTPVSGSPNYTVNVANAIASVTVTPTTTDPNATVKVNGTAVASGTASAAIPLNVGINTIAILATAQDGVTTQSYIITVTRPKSTNALLNTLHISAGTLSPVSGTPNFTSTVGAATTTVTATTADPTATVTVNGKTVTSGTASAAIPLTIGSNTITVVVTAQDGVTTQSYVITVNRLSNNALLSHIAISSGTLKPVTGSPNYTVSVVNSITSVTVTPITSDPTATVRINGTVVTSGTASAAIPLNVGAINVTIVVTAQDGVTTQPYVITVTRAPSSNIQLSHLSISAGTLSPVSGTSNFTATASAATTTVTATTADPTATVKVNGTTITSGTASAAIPLSIGTNTITVVVTAQDGVTTQSYVITVTRLSNNALLGHISISSGTLTPVSGTPNYTVNVANAVASVTVTPTTTDPNATVKVNGTAVASGTPSAAIPLSVGSNTINIIVTAQDGVTTQPYVITVTRAKSNNALLSHLSISSGTLTPVSGSPNYTVSVANNVTAVTVTPTTADPNATVTVDGTAVASGTASTAIALIVGANTITIVVTAQDGVTTQSYVITVTRATGPLMNLYMPAQAVSVTKPADNITIEDDGVVVHQGVSPNGDGVNDFLTIDGLAAYPDNNLMIIDRSGAIVFEVAGYDNINKVFDGHSSVNGRMQQPGTYFYALDYVVNGQNRHKTGFIVLKY